MGTVRIKDHWGEQRLFESRALAAAFIIAALTVVLVGRLVVLQVMRYDYYAELSQGNRVRVEPLPAQRGLILDRNGAGARREPPGLPARTGARARARCRRHAQAAHRDRRAAGSTISTKHASW